MDKQIIIARYHEDLYWTSNLDYDYLIYDKSENQELCGSNVIHLDNHPVGREAHTYLYHIIQNYDNLPNYTIFMQGEPFYHAPNILKSIKDNWNKEFRGFGYSCRSQNVDRHSSMKPFFEYILERELPKDLIFCAGAQMQISKQAIHRHPVEFYQKCFDSILTQDFITDGCIAVYFELIWAYIFLEHWAYDELIHKPQLYCKMLSVFYL